MPYDTLVSQKRRRLAESQLGVLALAWPHFTRDAVGKVSVGVKKYLTSRQFEVGQEQTRQAVFDQIGHYFYTNGGTGFGRIAESDKKTVGVDRVWLGILDTLDGGKVEQKLAIHDAVGRKLLGVLGGSLQNAYDEWGPLVREDWFDDKDRRGRIETEAQKKKLVKATNTPGIAPAGTKGTYQLPNVGQSRTRGVDMFARDPHRKRQDHADAYYDDTDTRNLLFGAGISGTTGTLLQAARAFGGLTGGPLLKEYVLAIVGYLVGGGMHSYHESMSIAQRVGVPYNPGGYLPSLPVSFIYSPQFAAWRDEYYDVVVLGATHWRFNPGVIPSHLNTNLRT